MRTRKRSPPHGFGRVTDELTFCNNRAMAATYYQLGFPEKVNIMCKFLFNLQEWPCLSRYFISAHVLHSMSFFFGLTDKHSLAYRQRSTILLRFESTRMIPNYTSKLTYLLLFLCHLNFFVFRRFVSRYCSVFRFLVFGFRFLFLVLCSFLFCCCFMCVVLLYSFVAVP